MTDYPLRAAALDEEGCAAVHAATIELLEHTGVEVQHDEALALLQKAGARVDGTRVQHAAGARRRRALRGAAQHPARRRARTRPASRSRAGPVYYGTGSDCLYMLGPGARERRPVSLADVEEMAALQEKLPAIDFVMSMAHPHELDAAFAPVAQFAAMLRGTSKPLIMVPEAGTDVALFKEMAAVCGAADSWAVYAMPTPPLVHGHHSGERLIRCAEQDVPDGLRRRVPAGRHGALVARRLPAAHQRRDAERPRHRPARQVRRALRVRRDAGRDERAHRPRALLRARRRWPTSRPPPTSPGTTTCRRSATAAARTPSCSTTSGRSRPA